jgi:catalase
MVLINSTKAEAYGAKMGSKTKLTRAAGIPVGDKQNSLTAGWRGPGPLSAWQLFIVPTVNPSLTTE